MHMTEPRKKGGQGRRYSDALKRGPVTLLANTHASAADVSAELGIGVGRCGGGARSWRQKSR